MNKNDFFEEFDNFVKGKNIDCEEALDKAFDEFMESKGFLSNYVRDEEMTEENAEDAYDYLELSDNASSKRQALEYAKKALSLEPDNWDVEARVIELSAGNIEILISKYKKLIAKANETMEQAGWFEEKYIGAFWGFHETRPYMQLRAYYFDILVNNSMFRSAVAEGEDLIRLCENDNIGIRYRLMHIYAFLEDKRSATKLFNKYREDRSTMLLLPMSILYYKLGDFKKSLEYLNELNKVNPDTAKFLKAMKNHQLERYYNFENSFGYRPFSIEEFLVAVSENSFLFFNIPQYFEWSLKKLKK